MAALASSTAFGCGNSGDGVARSGVHAAGGSAGLTSRGSTAGGTAGGALNTGESGSGGMPMTNGTGGVAGLAAGGGSPGGAGRTATMAGNGGQPSTAGQGGAGAPAGGSTEDRGGIGGVSGGPLGMGGQTAGSGNGPAGGSGTCPALADGQRSISFGTLLDSVAVTCSARQLAAALSKPSSSEWRAKGDQHRKYHFADAAADEPYRLYVPTTWDGTAELPLALFLHGSGSDENTYVDQNAGQMLKLAEEHGYLLVAPLGDQGAYGNFLRLSSPFGQPDEAAKLMAQVTADSERTNELSERDVVNVLELVLAEYPVDRGALFLFGHSMGSGGTWYLGGKYSTYWRGIAPMSGPFVQETGYPWGDLKKTFLFVTEGTQAPSVDGSRVLRDWLNANGFQAEYEEVNADHGGMVPLVLPDVFDFFDRARG
ncbi:MAG TPA: hypothetical protein VGQ57_08495 [Polyangiaceae bacterium]|nr:hypothetical protein [Polyangiaceae bacterium]